MQQGRRSETWLSKLSIRWILPAAVVVPVFAVAVVLTLLAYRTAQRTANDLAGQNIRHIHERIESHLDHLMNVPPAINQMNVARLRDGILDLDNPAQNQNAVFETLETFPEVSSIVLGSAQGRVMWVIRYPGETAYEYAIKAAPTEPMREYAMGPDGKVAPEPINAFPFDTVNRPWYRAAVEAGEPTWGNVYIWVRGGRGVTLGVSYVEPYRDEQGGVVGVINCELTLSDISAFLKRLRIGKSGMAFIVERDGNLVATSTGLDCMKEGVGRLPAGEAPDTRIAAAALHLRQTYGSLADIHGANLAHVEIDGEPMQMVVSSYSNRRNLDWLVVTLVPNSDFLADAVRSRNRGMLIGLIAVGAALGIGVWIALWLLKPILAVVDHARRVGSGQLDARLERCDNREIAQLSSALNEMAAGLEDRSRLRHALTLAMEVQQNLLPSHIPKVGGLDVAARSKYCDETGGDYYDYLEVKGIGANSLVIALGDVMGHGIAAALMMATARGVLRSQARSQGSLGWLLTHLNEHIAADAKGTRFMTMFLAVVDSDAMTMRWASAGHDQPLVYDPQHGFQTEIDPSGGGLPLGVMEFETYEEQTYAPLRPGQVVVVGTDGLWESKNDAGEQFGKLRVGKAISALAHLSAAEIEAGIYESLKQFCNGRANDDDITYLVIKVVGNTETTDAPAAALATETAAY